MLNNVRVITSSDRTILFSPSIILYQGPGNLTVKNSDFTEFYNLVVEARATIAYISVNDCHPDDEITQLLDFDNVTTSTLNYEATRDRFSIIG